ncbi:MAG: putative aarF domain-containing protein kinase 1 [Marteilia pararefringens]
MNPGKRLDDTIFDELNEKCARKIFKLCCRNQGIYCKFGQHVASASKNTKFLPDIYEKILANLEDQLITYQVLKVSQLREIFYNETSLNFNDVFTDINPIPIGTASLAQVFKAKLINTGEEVAIKVQHPGIEWKSKWDITVISMILKITKLIFPGLNFDFIINAIQKNLHKELDFTKEAENAILTAEEMKKLSKFYIPKVISSLSSSRILVTQYIKGQSLSKFLQTANACQRKKVVELIENMYYFMIFNLKKVHADPHAGNLIVICSENNPQDMELALLDHGLYLHYDKEFLVKYSNMILKLSEGTEDELFNSCCDLGFTQEQSKMFIRLFFGSETWKEMFLRKKSTPGSQNIDDPLSRSDILGILSQMNVRLLILFQINNLLIRLNPSDHILSLELMRRLLDFTYDEGNISLHQFIIRRFKLFCLSCFIGIQ